MFYPVLRIALSNILLSSPKTNQHGLGYRRRLPLHHSNLHPSLILLHQTRSGHGNLRIGVLSRWSDLPHHLHLRPTQTRIRLGGPHNRLHRHRHSRNPLRRHQATRSPSRTPQGLRHFNLEGASLQPNEPRHFLRFRRPIHPLLLHRAVRRTT